MNDAPPQPPPTRSVAARVVLLATSGLLALFALGSLAAGGVLMWANDQKDEQGYISTGSDRYSTSTAALATKSLDVDLDGAGWVLDPDRYGKVRLKVSPRSDKPVFVGIARSSDVSAYLGDTAHTTVTDVDYSPFRADYRNEPGARRATPPAGERFWAASAQGAGTQTVAWDVEDGTWSIVVMNADGSPGVDAEISAGAKVPYLSGFAWGFLGGGIVLLLGSAGLLVLAFRGPWGPRADAGTPDRVAAAA